MTDTLSPIEFLWLSVGIPIWILSMVLLGRAYSTWRARKRSGRNGTLKIEARAYLLREIARTLVQTMLVIVGLSAALLAPAREDEADKIPRTLAIGALAILLSHVFVAFAAVSDYVHERLSERESFREIQKEQARRLRSEVIRRHMARIQTDRDVEGGNDNVN